MTTSRAVAYQDWVARWLSFGFSNLAEAFKHNTIYFVIKTVTAMIHYYCYCLMVSGN